MINSPLRLLVHGASGRMGGALLRLAADAPDLQVVAAVSREGIAGGAIGLPTGGMDRAPDFDVAIDFSLPEALPAVLALCQSRGRPLVCGTTGIGAAERAALQTAAATIPVLWASNFSLGVVVLEDLVERASRALAGWEIRMSETHHVNKKDAPSGTAITLARAAERGSGRLPPIESIRVGEVVGDHEIELVGPGETLRLAHHAENRDIFALGALEAARRLASAPPGWHRLADLLLTA
ncbi:4-hydroxy-tetrahydrodipicolinate reductase [soil metagenome]